MKAGFIKNQMNLLSHVFNMTGLRALKYRLLELVYKEAT
jgi:hypothetical protein